MPTILITGSNRGLGLEFVKQYAEDGWTVLATCREPENATDLASLVGDIEIYSLDVGRDDHIVTLTDRLRDRPIDILLNNAALFNKQLYAKTFLQTETEAWMELFRINTIAPLNLTKAFIENVRISQQKTIVFISSRSGSISERGTMPYHKKGGSYAYRSSKAALNAVARSLAFDLKPDEVKVLAVHPGWVRTRLGGPDAPLNTSESVRGVRALVDNCTAQHSGKFFDYSGEIIDW